MRKFIAYDSARTVTKRIWIEARLELQIRRGSMFWNSFPRRTHSGTAVSQVTSKATGHNFLHWVPGLFPRVKGLVGRHCYRNLAPSLRHNGAIPQLSPVPSWHGTGKTLPFTSKNRCKPFPCYSRGIFVKICDPSGLCLVFYKW